MDAERAGDDRTQEGAGTSSFRWSSVPTEASSPRNHSVQCSSPGSSLSGGWGSVPLRRAQGARAAPRLWPSSAAATTWGAVRRHG